MLSDQHSNTVEQSTAEVERLTHWLEQVYESEYTATERRRILLAGRRYCQVLEPIVHKYIDEAY